MNARDVLPNYHAILEGIREPLYIQCKRVPIEVDLSAPEQDLWCEHDKRLSQLKRRKFEEESHPNLLDLKAELSKRLLNLCRLCERRCKVNRLDGKRGFCNVDETRVASKFVHWGEEPELIPSYTIFFSGCTFACVFCQNWDISQREAGVYIASPLLSRDIINRVGSVRNVNWVGGEPTPNLPYILEVLTECDAPLPQVWNSNMYMTEEAMRLLDGVMDLYLADFKYGPDRCSRRYSSVLNYWQVVSRNHLLANQQTEIVLRHLVMPNHVECCTKPVILWIAENLDNTRVRVNVMDQYHPDYRANEFPELRRRIKDSEFLEAWNLAQEMSLNLV